MKQFSWLCDYPSSLKGRTDPKQFRHYFYHLVLLGAQFLADSEALHCVQVMRIVHYPVIKSCDTVYIHVLLHTLGLQPQWMSVGKNKK